MTTRAAPNLRPFAERMKRMAGVRVECVYDSEGIGVYIVQAIGSEPHVLHVGWDGNYPSITECDCYQWHHGNDKEGCVHAQALRDDFQGNNKTMTSTTELTRSNGASAQTDLPSDEVMELVIGSGDIGRLTSRQRVDYILNLCNSLGLNPLSRPFEFITFQGKVVPYVRKDATDQLRKIHNVNIQIVDKRMEDGVYIITTRATMPNGRTDESTGAVSMGNLQGEAKANQIMKCETKSKRRVTLSICGLGFLDESEVSSIPGQQAVRFNHETGDMDVPVQRPVNQVQGVVSVSPDETKAIVKGLNDYINAAIKAMSPDVKAMWESWMARGFNGTAYKKMSIEQLATVKQAIADAVEIAGSLYAPLPPNDPEDDGVAQVANEEDNSDPFADN